MSVPHPFYPLDSNLVGYVAMDWDVYGIFTVFGVGIMVVLLATRMVSQKLSPNLHGRDQAFAVWFMICTFHLLYPSVGAGILFSRLVLGLYHCLPLP